MKKRVFYVSPKSQSIWLRVESVVCASTITAPYEVNDFSTITEEDVSSLWN